jgi:hypothetical protein
VTGFCTAALGFIAGAVIGAVVGVLITMPFSAEPHVGVSAAIGGSITGAVLGALAGFLAPKQFSCFKQSPDDVLTTKAAKLGNTAAGFFPAPLLPKQTIVKPPVEHTVVDHPADYYVAMKV